MCVKINVDNREEVVKLTNEITKAWKHLVTEISSENIEINTY